MPLGDRLGDRNNGDTAFTEEVFIDHGFLLVAGETGEFPNEDYIKGMLFFFCKRYHAVKVAPAPDALAGDAVIVKNVFFRDEISLAGCVLSDLL